MWRADCPTGCMCSCGRASLQTFMLHLVLLSRVSRLLCPRIKPFPLLRNQGVGEKKSLRRDLFNLEECTECIPGRMHMQELGRVLSVPRPRRRLAPEHAHPSALGPTVPEAAEVGGASGAGGRHCLGVRSSAVCAYRRGPRRLMMFITEDGRLTPPPVMLNLNDMGS